MNNFDELLQLVIKEAKAVNIPIANRISDKVIVNKRAAKRFGRCIKTGNDHVIELSAMLLDAPELSCKQTIAHELIHTCPGCMNHGEKFRYYADIMNRKYGYHISRTSSREEMGIEKQENCKYVIICQRCGNKSERSKRSSIVDHPSRYKCKCGGSLKVFSFSSETGAEFAVRENKAEIKYVLVCVKCGMRIERSKLSKAVKNPSAYRCKCGGSLKRIK